MADYGPDAIDFYNDIKEDGGPVTITWPVTDPEDDRNDVPQPWKGTDDEPDKCETFGLFIPESSTIASRTRFGNSVYIPGYKLEVNGVRKDIVKDCIIRMTNGNNWQVSAAPELNLDGRLPIYFYCQVTKWPGS